MPVKAWALLEMTTPSLGEADASGWLLGSLDLTLNSKGENLAQKEWAASWDSASRLEHLLAREGMKLKVEGKI